MIQVRRLRRQDSNLGPPGYEPGKLPLLHASGRKYTIGGAP